MESKNKYYIDHVTFDKGTLWGMAGGQLEYIGQEIIQKQDKDNPNRWDSYMRLKFTIVS